MSRSSTLSGRARPRAGRHPLVPAGDALEARIALNGTSAAAAALSRHGEVRSLAKPVTPVVGTISGQVTNLTNGKGQNRVQLQLLDATGAVVQAARTNHLGFYSFRIRAAGPYVVREVVPKHYTQVTPTFNTAAPTGALGTNPATGKPYTGASWNYKSGNNDPTNGLPVGPAHWGSIAPAGLLPFESPINIQGPAVDLGQVLSIHYGNTAPSKEVNTGSQIQVQVATSSADTITLGGVPYNLAQFHYHVPAENLVDGTTYPMEEHFVNLSASGAVTVVGVFLQLGPHNAALDPILNAALNFLDKTPSGTSTPGSNVGTINFAGLLPTNLMGWYYQGSLTTPPLSQVVNWLVLQTPITLDAGQLAEYQQVANDNGYLPNARPIQPLDGRRLNEIDYDVNFSNRSIAGLNFANAVGPQANTFSSSTQSAAVSSRALPVVSNGATLQQAAAAQNYQPLAGCNCPLCQMLRNAAWQEVSLPAVAQTTTSTTL